MALPTLDWAELGMSARRPLGDRRERHRLSSRSTELVSASSRRRLLAVGAARLTGTASSAVAASACGLAEPTRSPKPLAVRTHACASRTFIAAGYAAAAADLHLPSSSTPRSPRLPTSARAHTAYLDHGEADWLLLSSDAAASLHGNVFAFP